MTPSAKTHAAAVLERAEVARGEGRRAGREVQRDCRTVHRHAADVGARLDHVRALRTVPRGADAGDWRQAPAVRFETWLAHVRYARTRDPKTLDALVREYEAYALSLARRMHVRREPLEDLEQVAREALVVALNRFSPERGLPFPAFATPTILGAIRRHFRDRGWMIRVPRKVHEITMGRNRCAEQLTASLGRAPRDDEVASALGIDVVDLVEADAAAQARTPGSLDAPRADGSGALNDVVSLPDGDGSVSLEDRVALSTALGTLDVEDRELIGMYFFQDLTQTQIAERIGVSQMQVSRRLSTIVGRLRSRM